MDVKFINESIDYCGAELIENNKSDIIISPLLAPNSLIIKLPPDIS